MRSFAILSICGVVSVACFLACGGDESSDSDSSTSKQSSSDEVAQNDTNDDDTASSGSQTSDSEDSESDSPDEETSDADGSDADSSDSRGDAEDAEGAGSEPSDADDATDPPSSSADDGSDGEGSDPDEGEVPGAGEGQSDEGDPDEGDPSSDPTDDEPTDDESGDLDGPDDEIPIGPPIDGGPQMPTETFTPAECEAAGGTVVGDPGDGSVHRPGYVCSESGEPPIATVRNEEGGPIFIEGAVCCGGKGGSDGEVDCREVACFRAYECADECGGEVFNNGCCTCPEGTIDIDQCRDDETESTSCASDADCGPSEFCKTPTGSCDASGECAIKPDNCLDVYEPVCGCDGESYSNACYAEREGMSIGGDCAESSAAE